MIKDKFGVEFSDDMKTLINCPYNLQGEYIIPEGVTIIGEEAFYFRSYLTRIMIPNSVTTIESAAFCDCEKLTCITIPKSMTSIADNAFQRCSSVESITVEQGNPNYDSRDNCNALIETKTNTLMFGCKNTVIPKGIKIIGENAFQDCFDLTGIDIPDSVTTIGEDAFRGCSGIKSIILPNSVTTIGGAAFLACNALTDITMPESVTINEHSWAFEWEILDECESLRTIYVPAGKADYYKGKLPKRYHHLIVELPKKEA